MNKDRFLGLTGVCWTALSVVVAVIVGVISFLAWRHPVSVPSATELTDHKEISAEQQPETGQQFSGTSNSKAPHFPAHTTHAKEPDIKRPSMTRSRSPENTLQEVSKKEEISEAIRNFFTKFNSFINLKMDENDKIDKAYNDFFYTKGPNSLDGYEKFKMFVKRLVDRDVTFTFVNLINVSSVSEKKHQGASVEGTYTLDEQFARTQTKFTQMMISENGKDWKLYGWLENTSN